MAQPYDLTSKIGEYLDLHLMFPILTFMESQNMYPIEQLQQGKLELLSKTNMVDYAGDVYRSLHNLNEEDPLPDDMTQKKTALLEKLEEVHQKCSKFITLLEGEDKQKLDNIKKNDHFNLQYLSENYQITKEDVDALYVYAKFQYECGIYDAATECLEQFRLLNTDQTKDYMALWGKLASEILMSNWEQAEIEIVKIQKIIEEDSLKFSMNPLKQLQHRLWLLHWSLFVYFKRPQGASTLLDFFLSERYLRAIEFKAPWLLRYIAIALIVSKQKQQDIVKQLKLDTINYSDPITEFVRFLYVKYDFKGAERELNKFEQVLKQDFFIATVGDTFLTNIINNTKFAICEEYCKIHSTMDITMMSKKLQLSEEESETWIVNLIRGARLDAKIDTAKNRIIVTSQPQSVYQQVLDKTKILTIRATTVASNIERGKSYRNYQQQKLYQQQLKQQQQQQDEEEVDEE
eukprot:TRINITY_DN855_c1_g1_i1.p1 TRINITY_DN855_c1_g1~~TRINITY_DN855_c1_g1_i1.p1  ORF type:complete len:485 (+),score=85.79 TRINITY_DN855_c1_g1_i1:73-1455(+)